MDFKGLIFDLDGVLVDTAKYHFIAWQALAAELGISFTEEDNERLKGVSRVRSLEIILEIGGKSLPQPDFEAALVKKNEHYLEYIDGLTPDEILPGVQSFLNEAKAAGIPMALGSASKNAPRILDKLNLTPYFQAIVDGNAVSAAKPNPEVFLKGAAALEIPPGECVVFEDAQAGIDAANNGGMIAVGIGHPDVLKNAVLNLKGFEELTLSTLQTQLKQA